MRPLSKLRWVMKRRAIGLLVFLSLFFFAVAGSIGADVFRVIRVVDGDTIVLSNQEKVRLIGVDTPELHHPRKLVQYYAEEAYRFTQRIVEGKEVRLE